MLAWTRWPSGAWLSVAAVATIAWAATSAARSSWRAWAGVALLAAVAAGFTAHFQVGRLGDAWPEHRARRAAEVSTELRRRLDALLTQGEQAAAAAAALTDATNSFVELERIRRRYGMTAVGLYDPSGRLLAWAGDHRGPVPPAVRRGEERYIFADRPLFGYLYFTEPLAERGAGGGTAVAAALMRASAEQPQVATAGFAAAIEAQSGERLVISPAEQAAGETVWDLRYGDESLLSVTLAEPSQVAVRASLWARWRWIVVAIALLAFAFLALSWRQTGDVASPLVAAAVLAAAATLPVEEQLGAASLFDPAHFLLPGLAGMTLGRLFVVLAAAWLLVAAVMRSGSRALRVTGAVAVAAGFPLALRVVAEGASPELLAGPVGSWLIYHVTSVLTLALLAVPAVLPGRGQSRSRVRQAGAAAGFGLAAVICAVAVFGFEARVPPYWLAGLWAVPALLIGSSGVDRSLRHGVLRTTLAAGWLAVAAALPWSWNARTEARRQIAERQLGELGTPVDPYLDFLLHRMAESADSLAALGTGSVELLYGAWVASGLATEGYPMWLTLWSPDNVPLEELPIGVGGARPAVVDQFLEDARQGRELLVRRYDRLPGVHYLAYAPLPDRAVISAAVPPRRQLLARSPLTPSAALGASERDPLTLVPLPPGSSATDEVEWVRTEEGWHGEAQVAYPDAVYHAHYVLPRVPALVVVARGFLLLLVDLGALLALGFVGRAAASGLALSSVPWRSLFVSFRARVTLALFFFFLLPTALFGTLAYRTLAGAAARTARALAERAVDDAAVRYAEVGGDLPLLSRRVGADLLLYQSGELVSASTRELLELGFDPAWLPPAVYRVLASGEVVVELEVQSRGDQDYVVAYRRLPDGGVLAAPAALSAGATAVGGQEVTSLLAFAIAVGAALSLALALGAGRALAGPIGLLQRAADRVGRGDLKVRLPQERADEFGRLFTEFNHMILRLRRARRQLLLARRRTEAVVQAGATGIVALDDRGRVTAINPRAAELLGDAVVGEPLPQTTGVAPTLSAWLRELPAGGTEGDTELEAGERRIRVHMRRIAGGPEPGGIVLNLEDITDELRSERILAWGEMARHVAHEIKNPLTPVKLSVQHIRRAYEDRRPDFSDILSRNVEAILREIDRLARIVRGLSRFAAPVAAGPRPLEPVDVRKVVEETLELYAGGGENISYVSYVGAELPLVRARSDELREVLVNLVENARAAVRRTGTIVVEAAGRDTTIELAVRDDGTGVPPDLLPRIFEPYFSTRSTGSGLGLAIVQRLVESWGGSVDVESDPAWGSVFRVRMVLWASAPPAPPRGTGLAHED